MFTQEFLDRVRQNIRKTGRTGARSFWNFEVVNEDGVLLSRKRVPNIWHDEGEQWLAQVAFSEADTVPTAFYIGLDNRTTPAETDTLTSLSGEPSGSGYARQAVNSDATDWTVASGTATSKQVTFTASGGAWTAVQQAFMCDVLSGTAGDLFCTAALSQSRTLADGDSLNCTLAIAIGEA